MKTKSVIGIAFFLLLATISLFFYSENLSKDAQDQDKLIQSDFDALNYIHTSIEKDLLRIHTDKIKNFDSIIRFESLHRKTLSLLMNEVELLLENKAQTTIKLLKSYSQQHNKSLSILDNYKRNIVSTKNSLRYSTYLLKKIQNNLFFKNNHLSKEKLSQLISDILQYLLEKNVQNEQLISRHIQEINNYLESTENPEKNTFITLGKHLSVVIEGNRNTSKSLRKLLSSEHPQILEASYRQYLLNKEVAIGKYQFYSNLSILFTILLTFIILHSIYKLITSAGRLSQEKIKLEESVTESKESLKRSNEELKREIEQRIKYEDELQNAAILYQHCCEGVIICDKDKKAISANPAFSEITGISHEKAIGNVPIIFNPEEVSQETYEELSIALESIGRWKGEVVTTTLDGESTKSVSIICLKKNEIIYRYIVILIDISEQKKNEETIYRQANYDPLTKLPNRNLFNERAEQMLARAQRNNNNFATLFIDLDNFKKINDNLGHSIGDELLIQLSSRLQQSIRKTDTVSRFGGDEFIILVDNINHRHKLEKMINKLLLCLSTPIKTSKEMLHISGSIGISIYPENGTDISTLIRCADISMYKAKAQGKNTYCFFMDKMNIEIHQYLAMENQLRHAIDNNELYLKYQPIIDPITDKIYATEALARWHRNPEGRISPNKFIPIAEESSLITPIGEWILRTACKQLAQWNRQNNPDLKMNINISSLQFKNNDFGKMLFHIIRETGANPNNLNLEITENLFLEDKEGDILEILKALRNQGISISLDDFGTGYSSLSYLKRFPINVLKIDRSFIIDIIEDQSDQSLVKAIINMAKGLNISVVAEGVETQQQYDFLLSHQCDYIQGYYFSRPLLAENVQPLINPSHKIIPNQND